jgi:hypothetical protein
MKKIFVNICSYRDKLLAPTIQSLLDNESGRNTITYGIFEQTSLEDSLVKKYPHLAKHKQVRYKRIDPEYSDGVVWARAINAMQIYDEEFQYQVDSHMLFDKGWDNYLILDYMQGCRDFGHDKIVLSAGTKNFDLDEDRITKHILNDDISVKLGYYQFNKNMRLYAHGPWIPSPDKLQPSIHICAGNFFAPAKWVKEVGYNTNIYFEGEEQMLVLMSFLKGYKVLTQRRVKCYHYLRSSNWESKQTINPVISQEKIRMNQDRSEKELSNFLYSIDESVLRKYQEEMGVDFINRRLEERSISRHIKPEMTPDWEIPNKEENIKK